MLLHRIPKESTIDSRLLRVKAELEIKFAGSFVFRVVGDHLQELNVRPHSEWRDCDMGYWYKYYGLKR